VALQERLLGLGLERDHERRPGEARPHQEQVHLDQHAAQPDLRLPPVDLGLSPRVGPERHEHLADIAKLPPPLADIPAHLPLGHLRAVLLDQPLPDPPSRVSLLGRRVTVRLQPGIDHRPQRAELGRRPRRRRPLRRRHRRLQRLPHRPPVHAMAPRQRPDRQPLPRVIAPDLLELLHSRHSFWAFRLALNKSATRQGSARTEVGPVQASTAGPVQTSTPILPWTKCERHRRASDRYRFARKGRRRRSSRKVPLLDDKGTIAHYRSGTPGRSVPAGRSATFSGMDAAPAPHLHVYA